MIWAKVYVIITGGPGGGITVGPFHTEDEAHTNAHANDGIVEIEVPTQSLREEFGWFLASGGRLIKDNGEAYTDEELDKRRALVPHQSGWQKYKRRFIIPKARGCGNR